MIELTVRIGQAVILNDLVVVRVLDMRHRDIKLGLDAPKDVQIARTELLTREPRGSKKS